MIILEFVFFYLVIGVFFACFLIGFAIRDVNSRNHCTSDVFALLILLWPFGVMALIGAIVSVGLHKLFDDT